MFQHSSSESDPVYLFQISVFKEMAHVVESTTSTPASLTKYQLLWQKVKLVHVEIRQLGSLLCSRCSEQHQSCDSVQIGLWWISLSLETTHYSVTDCSTLDSHTFLLTVCNHTHNQKITFVTKLRLARQGVSWPPEHNLPDAAANKGPSWRENVMHLY